MIKFLRRLAQKFIDATTLSVAKVISIDDMQSEHFRRLHTMPTLIPCSHDKNLFRVRILLHSAYLAQANDREYDETYIVSKLGRTEFPYQSACQLSKRIRIGHTWAYTN